MQRSAFSKRWGRQPRNARKESFFNTPSHRDGVARGGHDRYAKTPLRRHLIFPTSRLLYSCELHFRTPHLFVVSTLKLYFQIDGGRKLTKAEVLVLIIASRVHWPHDTPRTRKCASPVRPRSSVFFVDEREVEAGTALIPTSSSALSASASSSTSASKPPPSSNTADESVHVAFHADNKMWWHPDPLPNGRRLGLLFEKICSRFRPETMSPALWRILMVSWWERFSGGRTRNTFAWTSGA